MLIRCVAPCVRRWEFHADCTHASFPRSANFFFSPQRDALDCGAKAHPLSGCITEQQKLLRLPRWLKFLSAPSAEITNANSKIGSQGETRAQFSYTHIPFWFRVVVNSLEFGFDNVNQVRAVYQSEQEN